MNEQSENKKLKKLFESYTYPVDDSNWEEISARMPAGAGQGLLTDKFADYTFRPSPKVWRRIEAVLVPASKNRFAAWWWYAAAASLLFIAYFGYFDYNSQTGKTSLAQEKVKTENHTGTTDNAQNSKSKSTVAVPDSTSGASVPFSAKANELNSGMNGVANVEMAKANSGIENSAFTKATIEKPSTEDEILASAESQIRNQQTGNGKHLKPDLKNEYPVAGGDNPFEKDPETLFSTETSGHIYLDKVKLHNPEIQIPESKLELTAQQVELPSENTTSDQKKVKSSPFYSGTKTTATNEISLLAGSQLAFGSSPNQEDYLMGIGSSFAAFDAAQSKSTEYATPVSYGVNGEIKFWNRFSAGTGLGYLQMKNTSTYYTAENRTNEQNQHRYLAIPVYIKFNFINKPKFAVYTSLGNSYEFLIWQRTTIETYTNGQLSSEEFTNAGEKGNQANIYTGLGMHFKFTRHFGIFAEGSLMHYYQLSDNNFFKQKNLWPGLKFGALVSF